MKLMQSPVSERMSRKRKFEFEEDNRLVKRFFTSHSIVGADVMQENLQRQFINTGVTTLSTAHCKKYPINGEIIDGLYPHPHMPNNTLVNTSSVTTMTPAPPCSKCLSGQSGHWRHTQSA